MSNSTTINLTPTPTTYQLYPTINTNATGCFPAITTNNVITNATYSYGGGWYVGNDRCLRPTDPNLQVQMDDGKVETITREDLIKYIGELKLIRENELVRKMYDRYQVAVKLVRSDDDGETGP